MSDTPPLKKLNKKDPLEALKNFTFEEVSHSPYHNVKPAKPVPDWINKICQYDPHNDEHWQALVEMHNEAILRLDSKKNEVKQEETKKPVASERVTVQEKRKISKLEDAVKQSKAKKSSLQTQKTSKNKSATAAAPVKSHEAPKHSKKSATSARVKSPEAPKKPKKSATSTAAVKLESAPTSPKSRGAIACGVCNKYTFDQTNILIPCGDCHGTFHQKCHDPPISNPDPRNVFQCSNCQKDDVWALN